MSADTMRGTQGVPPTTARGIDSRLTNDELLRKEFLDKIGTLVSGQAKDANDVERKPARAVSSIPLATHRQDQVIQTLQFHPNEYIHHVRVILDSSRDVAIAAIERELLKTHTEAETHKIVHRLETCYRSLTDYYFEGFERYVRTKIFNTSSPYVLPQYRNVTLVTPVQEMEQQERIDQKRRKLAHLMWLKAQFSRKQVQVSQMLDKTSRFLEKYKDLAGIDLKAKMVEIRNVDKQTEEIGRILTHMKSQTPEEGMGRVPLIMAGTYEEQVKAELLDKENRCTLETLKEWNDLIAEDR